VGNGYEKRASSQDTDICQKYIEIAGSEFKVKGGIRKTTQK